MLDARFWLALAMTGAAAGLFGDLMMSLLFSVQHLVYSYSSGPFEQAVEKASDLNPSLTRAYDERGRLYMEKGDTRRAIEMFTKSIRIQPTTDGYYQRGLAYEAVGEHQKAVDDYDLAINEQRDAPYAYRARALARDALGDHDGAAADRETAQRIESR